MLERIRAAIPALPPASSAAWPMAQLVLAANQIVLAVDHGPDSDRYSPMLRLLHLVAIDILATGVALRIGSQMLYGRCRSRSSARCAPGATRTPRAGGA